MGSSASEPRCSSQLCEVDGDHAAPSHSLISFDSSNRAHRTTEIVLFPTHDVISLIIQERSHGTTAQWASFGAPVKGMRGLDGQTGQGLCFMFRM
jgi:hypothetical protein